MAVVFAERGNQKRALELIDEALASRDDGVQLHLTRAQILIALGRPKDARESIDRGLGLDAADHELLRLRQQIGE